VDSAKPGARRPPPRPPRLDSPPASTPTRAWTNSTHVVSSFVGKRVGRPEMNFACALYGTDAAVVRTRLPAPDARSRRRAPRRFPPCDLAMDRFWRRYLDNMIATVVGEWWGWKRASKTQCCASPLPRQPCLHERTPFTSPSSLPAQMTRPCAV
jgi:hypothetical protein